MTRKKRNATKKYIKPHYWSTLYGKLLKIVWRDSISFLDPNIQHINRLITVESSGWLVDYEGDVITIASFRDNDPHYSNDSYYDQYHNFTIINMHSIQKVRVI